MSAVDNQFSATVTVDLYTADVTVGLYTATVTVEDDLGLIMFEDGDYFITEDGEILQLE